MAAGEKEPPLAVLTSLLAVAAGIVDELIGDPLLERLLKAFTAMPEGDREIVVGVIEREVQTRLVSQDVADTLTQVALRPNPNAQLYFRVIEPEHQGDVEMIVFLRAIHTVQKGIDSINPNWRTLVREAMRHIDPAAREKMDAFNRAMREILDECRRDEPGTPDGAAGGDDAVTAVKRSRRS